MTKLMLLIAVFFWMLASAQTKVDPNQLKAPTVVVMSCSGTTTNADCAGLYYVDVVTPAGTEIKIIGARPDSQLDTTRWSIVP